MDILQKVKKIKAAFRKNLLAWYRQNHRKLPWRRNRDPYAIWVSEIMLQQTQVATVIPYFEKFMKRFPTLQSLAQAQEEEVLALWSGLGYYRRAKLLHRGAQQVLTQFNGRLPCEVEALKKLPSIGPYTAGAIASIAFGLPEPLVDGNVVRVLSRVFCLKGHRKDAQLHKTIWNYAKHFINEDAPGDFNQALMELGATRCRVALPNCDLCPVKGQCLAFQQGDPEAFPEAPPKNKTIQLNRLVAIAETQRKILFVKRSRPRWFKGMWELPYDFCEKEEVGLQRLDHFLENALEININTAQEIDPTKHGITHHRITSFAWHGKIKGNLSIRHPYHQSQLVSFAEINQMAISNFDRKVLKAAQLI